MCGRSEPGGLSSEVSREAGVLSRNVSNCSSGVVNNHLAALSAHPKGACDGMPLEQPDDCVATNTDNAGYHSRNSSSIGATSLLRTCDDTPEAAEPAIPPSQLLLGTSAGLFLLNLKTRDIHLLGLQDCAVGHVTYHSGGAYASCPVMDTGSLSTQHPASTAVAGLYRVDLSVSVRNPQVSPFKPAATCIQKLWDGNAKCAAVSNAAAEPGSYSTATGSTAPRIYLGTQPADVLYSDDLGVSWYSTELSSAPASQQWYHRLPPYEPCVRSISCSSNSGSTTPHSPKCSSGSVYSWSTDCDAQHQPCQQPGLLVGVEVGGIYSCDPPQVIAADMDCSSSSEVSWSESSAGLCKDVQCLQPDPWSSKRLYAVTGSGSLPGGLYRSRAHGQKWKRLYGYRYSVGMAISPYEKGRLLLLSADKPPEIGCNLFESLDGGRHWVNSTDDIYDALLNLTKHAPGLFDHTPVCTFVPGGLIVACVTGHVFLGQAGVSGGYTGWQLLCEVPAAVNCLCLTNESAAPVNISRW